MRQSILSCSTVICLSMGLGTSGFADTTQTAGASTAPAAAVPAPQTATAPTAAQAASTRAADAVPAKACFEDLIAFDTQMRKDGNWFGGISSGYGYPMTGAYGAGDRNAANSTTATGDYMNVRPGYEVRTLIAGASILAKHGQQAACETVLATSRDIYKTYSAEMKNGNIPMGDASTYHAKQIAGAVSVATLTRSIRSDELLGTDLRNTKDEALGSVDDLLMSPQTGQIAYLVISRGGFFGFDQKYVPIPWADFAITPDGNFLVLNATKDMLKAAPQVDHNQVMDPGQFATESKVVDAYWAKTLPPKAGN